MSGAILVGFVGCFLCADGFVNRFPNDQYQLLTMEMVIGAFFAIQIL